MVQVYQRFILALVWGPQSPKHVIEFGFQVLIRHVNVLHRRRHVGVTCGFFDDNGAFARLSQHRAEAVA